VTSGREPKTAMAIIDSKSVKNTGTAEEKGYGAGKKLQGHSASTQKTSIQNR
jgi:hypothetical protein